MKRYSQRHEAEVIDLYQEGHGLPTIERLLGVPRSSTWNILVRNGIERRPLKAACAGNEPPKGPLDVVELTRTTWLHEQGLTYAQIGELLGVGRLAVKARIQAARDRLGYKQRNSGRVNRTLGIPAHVQKVVANWAA